MSDFTDWIDRHAEVLHRATPAPSWIDPETMMAVGAYVPREYGYAGYGVRVIAGDRSGALCNVSHADGSSFLLWADRYGNVGRVPDAATV
jgi:hypothetical protein